MSPIKRGTTRWAVAALVFAVVAAAGMGVAQAWAGHELITLYALRELPELADFEKITPTQHAYSDVDTAVVGPNFKIHWAAGEDQADSSVSALQVLTAYSAEPDWYMDTDLKLSSIQVLTGGSQGWRHQRYILFWPVAFGVGPDRAQYFYNLALEAYKRGDTYWAFRFLARSLHYVEDLGQPLHTLPLPVSDFVFRYGLSVKRATYVGLNVHSTLEDYIEAFLKRGDPRLVDALSGTDAPAVTSVKKAALAINGQARKYAEKQYRAALKIWPQLDANKDVRLTEDERVGATQPEASVAELWTVMEVTLKTTGFYARGLIEQFFKDAQKIDATR